MPEVPVNFADIYSPQPVSYTKLVHFGLLDVVRFPATA
jgi:hypothetical protein